MRTDAVHFQAINEMLKIKYIDKHEANISNISKFEKLIGEQLPDDYKQFLLISGGGEIEDPYCFHMSKPGTLIKDEMNLWDGINSLASFHSNKMYDLFHLFNKMSSEEREFPFIPSEFIAIGNSGSSCLLLGVKAEYKGKVFFWHDSLFHGDENEPEIYDNISFVANSFEGFLDSLYLDE